MQANNPDSSRTMELELALFRVHDTFQAYHHVSAGSIRYGLLLLRIDHDAGQRKDMERLYPRLRPFPFKFNAETREKSVSRPRVPFHLRLTSATRTAGALCPVCGEGLPDSNTRRLLAVGFWLLAFADPGASSDYALNRLP